MKAIRNFEALCRFAAWFERRTGASVDIATNAEGVKFLVCNPVDSVSKPGGNTEEEQPGNVLHGSSTTHWQAIDTAGHS